MNSKEVFKRAMEKAKQGEFSIKFSLQSRDRIKNYSQFWDVLSYVVENIYQTKDRYAFITSEELLNRMVLEGMTVLELLELVKLISRIHVEIKSDTVKHFGGYYSYPFGMIYQLSGTRENGVDTIESFKFHVSAMQPEIVNKKTFLEAVLNESWEKYETDEDNNLHL